MRADELPNAGAVHVDYLGHIQQDVFVTLLEQVHNDFAKHHVAFAERNPAADVHDGVLANLARGILAAARAGILIPRRSRVAQAVAAAWGESVRTTTSERPCFSGSRKRAASSEQLSVAVGLGVSSSSEIALPTAAPV